MSRAQNVPPPLSPVSMNGSDFYTPGPSGGREPAFNNRGIISPPNSGGSSVPPSPMNGAFGNGGGFPGGGPSPPASIARSSQYARSESGRSMRDEQTEVVLGEHYVSLKRFLAATSRDGRPNPPPNKARDKLQRLTGVQFLELSTDVFDELRRREAFSRRPPNANPNSGPPPYLMPEENFHPKRNQARQKLSSLGPPRFRDLATDVFCELERRYPRFAAGDLPRPGSSRSLRAPSRTGTPVNGNGSGLPPRGQSRRRPSEASSIRSGLNGAGGRFGDVPPSPGLPQGDFGRPMAKQFQSNTIVPNKSTMVEEDDPISPLGTPEGDNETFGLGSELRDRESKRSGGSAIPSENDKKLIEEYESQVRDLREKLENMEDAIKKKDDEMTNLLDEERTRATAANSEKREWSDLRLNLENKLAEAENLNDSMKQELDRIGDDHAQEMQEMQREVEKARQASTMNSRSAANPQLEQENQELRMALQEQQQVAEEVRREAQDSLREMRMLSEQSGSSLARYAEMERTIEQLEREVRDWRNRYSRTKTQLRNMRASSMGLTIEQDMGKLVREKGFAHDNGLVKDVHVTKFQISVEEMLQRARGEDLDKVIDSMKVVVMNVRRITKDIDESGRTDPEMAQTQAKLKGRVSSTANNLITAAKNYAAAAGISPVSLLDAAASHLVAAVVELLRTVKIRATPAGELDDDDDGTITPVDSTGFFTPNINGQATSPPQPQQKSPLAVPPAFQGLGGIRASSDSSAYSPVNSPRESVDQYSAVRQPMSRGGPTNGGNGTNGYMGLNKGLPAAPAINGYGAGPRDTRSEDLKVYLDDQTATLVQTIQSLVGSIRGDARITEISPLIENIADIVGQVVTQTEQSGNDGPQLDRLASCRQRILEAGERGASLAQAGKGSNDPQWRMWTQTLPPIAFEIARETKELVQRIDQLVMDGGGGGGGDDFA